MIRRTVIVAAATLSVALAPGIAQAVPGEPGQCSGTGYCQVEPPSNGTLDGAGIVTRGPSAWDQFRSIAGHALADIFFGPQW